MYYREPREPLPLELDVIQIAARLAGIAIQRDRAEKELVELNRSLESRIDARTEELARANAKLARSNEELSQFTMVASHDLQAPLRQVQSFCELLKQHHSEHLDDEANEWMSCILQSSTQMQHLLDDLLDYSRIDRQTRPFEQVDLNQLMKQVLANLASSISESAAQIACDDLPTVSADAVQLIQLFQNLVSNAIKFCDQPPSRIHIGAESNGDEWLVSVRDNGIGIDEQFHEQVFDFFRRLHSVEKYPGTGIGLAICKRVVERHGGRIWVESRLGEGSTFGFAIPRKQVGE